MNARHGRLALLVMVLLTVTSSVAPVAAADGPTLEDAMAVVDDGPDVSEERARIVFDWVANNDVSELNQRQQVDIYRWMLRRQHDEGEYVPSVLEEEVADALPSEDATELRSQYAPSTSTATAVPRSTSTASAPSNSSAENTTVVQEVDEFLRITDYRYNASSETFYVQLENTGESSSESSSVTITEVISQRQAGSGTFGIETLTVDPGETVWVDISAKRVSGTAAVMVVSQRSVEDGSGVYLQEAPRENPGLIPGGASGADVRTAGFSGIFGALLVAFLAAWQRHVMNNEDVTDARLKPKLNLWGRFRRD